MFNFYYLLIGYLIIISLVSVIVTITDKYQAQKQGWRVPEATLLTLSAMGGSVAMYVTMQLIRHKTRKLKFMLGIPAIMVLQAALVIGVIYLAKS